MKTHDWTTETRVILFWDLHDFSIVMKSLGPDLYDFLQELYENLGDVIVAHDGEIIKYLGDALLCIFPAGSESDAIECALEMRTAYAELIERRNIPHGTELEVGIASGDVIIGTFGHPSLRQRDIFGQEVNRAAKIGHHRGIAVTENVYQKIKATYQTRRLPDFQVKWQSEPLKVWEIAETNH